MKYRYRFHYADYAIGENEQLYEKMAAKGWKLTKRGAHLSKFERCNQQSLRYRIEISSPDFLEDTQLPEEQVALYEDCGWKFVSGHELVHVFCAPEGSEAQEFYTDPRQQASTLKALRRNYRSSWISIFALLSIHILIAYGLTADSNTFLPGVWASFMEAWFRSTELVLTYAVLLVSALYDMIYGTIRTSLLYKRLKSGKPLDHAPKKRTVYRVVKGAFRVLQGIALVMLLLHLFSIDKYEMPLKTDEPYLTLTHDLAVAGERDAMHWQSDGSTVERGHSLAAQSIWYTHEHVGDQWLYQHIYLLRDEKQAEDCVRMLMYASTFADSPKDYTEVNIKGLDEAYKSGLEGIAVKGRLVYYMTYSERNWEEVFDKLSNKLN